MRDSPQLGAVIGGSAAALLADRYVLIVGIVGEDGWPYATRGWGLTVLPSRPGQLRLVLSSDDGPQLHKERDSRPIALTAADPRTLRAFQLKGQAGPAEPATAEDRAAAVRFCESFFSVVEELDGRDRRLLEPMVPDDFVACTIVIDERFDQTPGPGAGAALPGGGP